MGFVVHGSWFLVPGSWFLVPGSWFLVPGSEIFKFLAAKAGSSQVIHESGEYLFDG